MSGAQHELFPEDFRQSVVDIDGPAGEIWLTELPDLVSELEDDSDLLVGDPFALSHSFVAPARTNKGGDVVIKLAPPSRHSLKREAEALRCAGGTHSLRLLAERDGALLLERANPGYPLAGLAMRDDRAATAAAVEVMTRYWANPPLIYDFPLVADLASVFSDFRRTHAPIDQRVTALLDRAEELFAELISTNDEQLVLHGNLHHRNIVAAQRKPWLAINPRGIVGERAYECAPFLRSPREGVLTGPAPRVRLEQRIVDLANGLELDADRIRKWAIAQTMLALIWQYRDERIIAADTMAFLGLLDA